VIVLRIKNQVSNVELWALLRCLFSELLKRRRGHWISVHLSWKGSHLALEVLQRLVGELLPLSLSFSLGLGALLEESNCSSFLLYIS